MSWRDELWFNKYIQKSYTFNNGLALVMTPQVWEFKGWLEKQNWRTEYDILWSKELTNLCLRLIPHGNTYSLVFIL